MKEIALTRGKVALVDDADYEWINQWKWQFLPAHRTQEGYAWRKMSMLNKLIPGKTIAMHRVIINAQPGQEVDHRNGDKLDNRRENLRICTSAQNKFNIGKSRKNTSGYKGVCWHKQKHKWRAQVTFAKKDRHLGFFANAEEAARAYDCAVKELAGEFAQLNFPD